MWVINESGASILSVEALWAFSGIWALESGDFPCPCCNLNDESHRMFNVRKIHDAAWRMEITAGNRNDGCQNAAPTQMNGPRVGPAGKG